MWYGWHVVRCIPDIFKLWKYLRPFVVAVCPVERLGVCLAQKRSPSTGDMYTVFHWKRGTQSRPQLQGKKRNREKRNLWICRPLPRYIISSCTMYQFFLKQLYLGAPPQLSEQDRCSAAVLCLYQSPPIWILMSHVRIPHPSASLKQAVCPWTIDASFPAYHWATIIESLQLINDILIWAQQFPHGATLTRTSLRWSGLATLTGWRFVHSWHLWIWKSLKAFYHLLSLWVHYKNETAISKSPFASDMVRCSAMSHRPCAPGITVARPVTPRWVLSKINCACVT